MKTMKGRKAKGAYWMKRILPMVAFVTAGLMTACNDKPNDDSTPAEPFDPVKVLTFTSKNCDSIQYDNVMKYANDPRITKIIYFNDSNNNNNNYTGHTTELISVWREYLQERLDYTPKATGGGNFIFWPGRISVEDSLWFVANNWTVNQQAQPFR